MYGMKVLLEFSDGLGKRLYFSSSRMPQPTTTQLIAKQEVYARAVGDGKPPYECTWSILPEAIDDRIITQGTPVPVGAPLVLSHCFTNKRLAGVNVTLPNDFGWEPAVCAHTYTETGKVNKLMRECKGRPTNPLITRTETLENYWTLIYA